MPSAEPPRLPKLPTTLRTIGSSSPISVSLLILRTKWYAIRGFRAHETKPRPDLCVPLIPHRLGM